ncbi:hypothetical protein HDU96_003922 [Phlyctochytrium bullatum]|nr:hypothetical protein HDU96_003922 [Phlyctochytrium bullatum]
MREKHCQIAKVDRISLWKPTETRWYSFGITIRQLLSLREAIESLRELDSNFLSEAVRVNWEKLKEFDKLLRPYHWIQALSESDHVTSGQVFGAWAWLYSLLGKHAQSNYLPPGNVYDQLQAQISTRFTKYAEDHHLVCWVLDPRVHGAGLSGAGFRRAKEKLIAVHSRLFPESSNIEAHRRLLDSFYRYYQRTGSFKRAYLWQHANLSRPPTSFWADFLIDEGELASVAIAVLSYTCHVASCERTWSSLASLHTKSRNRLKLQSLEAMEKIRIFHRNSKEKEKTLRRAWLKLAQGIQLKPDADPNAEPNVEPRTLENHAGDDMVLDPEDAEDEQDKNQPEKSLQQPAGDEEDGFDGHFLDRIDRFAGLVPEAEQRAGEPGEERNDRVPLLNRLLEEIDNAADSSPGNLDDDDDDAVAFDGSENAINKLTTSIVMQISFLLN